MEEQSPRSVSTEVIKHGETYHHWEHGRVKVTDIWHRTRQLNVVSTDEQGMVVVRYLPAEGGKWNEERTEPLTDFIKAIN